METKRSRKGEGGSGNGPSAFEGRLEVTGKVNDIDEFCMAAEGSTNVVVEKELEWCQNGFGAGNIQCNQGRGREWQEPLAMSTAMLLIRINLEELKAKLVK